MKQTNHCAFTRERFLSLEDGSLGPDAAVAVRAHLGDCPACRAAWAAWQEQDRLLRAAIGPVAAPSDIAGAAIARIRAGEARVEAPSRREFLRWGLAAAAAALLALGAWALLGRRYQPIGQLEAIEGQVLARQRGARRLAPIEPGATIYEGDELVAAVASRAAVAFYDRSRLALAEATAVRLHAGACEDDDGCELGLPHVCLSRGEVECGLASLRYFRAVGTPLGTAIVQGTRFRMRYIEGKALFLEVLEGEVCFSAPDGEAAATPGAIWAIEAPNGRPRRLEAATWDRLPRD